MSDKRRQFFHLVGIYDKLPVSTISRFKLNEFQDTLFSALNPITNLANGGAASALEKAY